METVSTSITSIPTVRDLGQILPAKSQYGSQSWQIQGNTQESSQKQNNMNNKRLEKPSTPSNNNNNNTNNYHREIVSQRTNSASSVSSVNGNSIQSSTSSKNKSRKNLSIFDFGALAMNPTSFKHHEEFMQNTSHFKINRKTEKKGTRIK